VFQLTYFVNEANCIFMIFFGYSLSVSILYTIDVFLYAFSLGMHLIVNFLLYNFVLCFFMISLVSC